MKNVKRKVFCVLCIILLFIFPITSFAHSGRTDSQGGHRDNKNKSGLGSYHYHHGMEAHLHPNGVCPYSAGSSEAASPASSYTPEPEISMKEYPGTLYVGESAGLEFSVSNATSEDSSITSSDSNILKVNSDGTLTAVGAGVAQITIKASGATKIFDVEVKTVPVEEIQIMNELDKLQLGEDYQFSARVLPENATNKNISWLSDNEDILEISDSGKVTTKDTGIVTITAVSENNVEAKTTLEIYEVLPENIECEESINMIVGDKREFQINILPDDSNKKNYTVASEDSSILKCENSSLQALAEGVTTLHIETWNGIRKDIPVEVDIILVESIEIEDETLYLSSNVIDKSTEILLSAKVNPSDATYQDVEWSSSDNDILSVEDNQFVIRGTGEVTLTCTAYGDVAESITFKIIDSTPGALGFLLVVGALGGGSVWGIRKKRLKSRAKGK